MLHKSSQKTNGRYCANPDLYRAKKDRNIVIIDVMHVMKALMAVAPHDDIQSLGPSQTIVEVVYEKTMGLFICSNRLASFIYRIRACNYEFSRRCEHATSTTTAVSGNHRKRSRQTVMVSNSVFPRIRSRDDFIFQSFFKKRINEEPSPLEVEMFQYQQSLDQYVIMHENKEAMRRMDDDS